MKNQYTMRAPSTHRCEVGVNPLAACPLTQTTPRQKYETSRNFDGQMRVGRGFEAQVPTMMTGGHLTPFHAVASGGGSVAYTERKKVPLRSSVTLAHLHQP